MSAADPFATAAPPEPTEGPHASDAARLERLHYFLYGSSPREGRRRASYAAYVAILVAVTYGVPTVQALFRTTDPTLLAAVLTSPWTGLACIALVLVALVAVFRAGRLRGPVLAPLDVTDHILTTPIDRALVLVDWWRLSLFGAVFGGALLGAVLSSGLVIARATGAAAIAVGVVAGAALGLVVARVWLAGQVKVGPAPARDDADGSATGSTAGSGDRSQPGASATRQALVGSTRAAMRALRRSDLRAQAVRSDSIGGAVLAGDLRSIQLQVATPVRRGRGLRLRPGRPVPTVARRDLLGLARQPAKLVSGLALTAVGMTLVQWGVSFSSVPVLLVAVGAMTAHLGFGAWADGLRLQGDNAGTSPMIGLPFRTEALAHLIVPSVLFAAVAAVASAVLVALGAPDFSPVWILPVVGMLAGAHLIGAFRGPVPHLPFSGGGSSPQMILIWFVMPIAISVILVSATTSLAAHSGLTAVPLAVAFCLGSILVTIGLSRAESLELAHR